MRTIKTHKSKMHLSLDEYSSSVEQNTMKILFDIRQLKQQRRQPIRHLKKKTYGNFDYFVIIVSQFLANRLLTEHAENGLVEAPLKYI